MVKPLAWILFAGSWCSAQTMPYPVAYVYPSSVLGEESRSVTGATVPDSAGLSLGDSSGTCYDGLFTIRSEGTQEYCPIASAYLPPALSHADQELQPHAYAKSARWVPEAVHFQKGETKSCFTVAKTAGCSTGNAGLTFNISPNPSFMVFKIIGDPQKTISFSGQEAQADRGVRFDANNGTDGEVLGTGILNPAPCQIPIPSSRREATLRVQAP